MKIFLKIEIRLMFGIIEKLNIKKFKMKNILVIALEGIHGVGKTTKMKELFKENYSGSLICMDESFIPKVKSHFHPQSFFSESVWALNWFKRLENICSPYFDFKTQRFCGDVIILADRSAYSACIYSKDGNTESLRSVINENIKQFKKRGIIIKICYLENKKTVILKRIKNRLKGEVWRKMLKEDDEKKFYDILKKYKDFTSKVKCIKIKDDTSLLDVIKLI